mmetsp:Transcript_126568/g.253041  ORF Transcript_126568/g.253041 Transcript_126568/m.253041 type:complete len:340 (+) Transcript_126568:132-1151(+)|eukprot:CAMPEP_0172689624 /NCGR_PEP_ID=MMETSP1074-20121228/23286_1 /TAXON_ID=2916 /ORGANISM="Ceratium fusus, Strain PA161109" /LENGTH=339 /DNA_ID=CAMNT_0013509457 /DNA_START=29 /DNA_END=1048 /DNA_ORIENTATION=+
MIKNAMREALSEARQETHQLLRKKESKTQWEPIPVATCIFWPVLLYAYVYCMVSGSMRFHHLWLAIILGPLLCLLACIAASMAARGRLRRMDPGMRTALTLSVCLWLAFVVGMVAGDRNYWWYMTNYYTYQDLATYTDIDPSSDKGQSYMDSGQIYFKEGSKVERAEMMAYKSVNTFCVAPITSQTLWNTGSDAVETGGPMKIPESGTVDFWAVGTDCCSTQDRTFNCGAANNTKARSGLRLLRDDSRPFYYLAVQEWVAKHCPVDDNSAAGRAKNAPLVCLPARHPLFFYWVQDPMLEVDSYGLKAQSLFNLHVFTFFILDIAVTLGGLWLLFRLGMK